MLLDVSAAGDVVHDAFLAFIGSGERFRLTGSLMGYLLTCVANRNHNKAARRRQALQSTGMGRAGPELPPLALSKTPISGNVRTESGTPDARDGAQTDSKDRDLAELIDRWPSLPQSVRAKIIKLATMDAGKV